MPRLHWETKEGYTVDPAESTLVNVYMRKKGGPFARANG